MKYGFVYPGGLARDAALCAVEAERAGWDAFFVWDPVWGEDAWATLAVCAMLTKRIRLGTMITPVSRRRPWKLASETATVDRLSRGRLILSVGLGAIETGFTQFGEETDRKRRSELLDEGLDILTGLWGGQPFKYDGKYYHVRETRFIPPPPPYQKPRIQIWVVGAWNRAKSMRRALRFDGLLPNVMTENGEHRKITPRDVREIRSFLEANGVPPHYDLVVEGVTSGLNQQRAASTVQRWADSGATWWNEAIWKLSGDSVWEEPTQKKILLRVKQGPPRI